MLLLLALLNFHTSTAAGWHRNFLIFHCGFLCQHNKKKTKKEKRENAKKKPSKGAKFSLRIFMTRREGGRLAWGWCRVVQGGTGVCRSSAVVVVVALLPACPLKWCKIYEARHPQPTPHPPLSPILLNFIPSGQK